APIIGLQTVGYFYISYMSLSHTRFKRIKSLDVPVLTKKEKMAKRTYQLSMVGVFAIIIFGGFMAINGYHSDVYPLDRIRGNLDGIIGSTDPTMIKTHLTAIKQDLVIVMDKLPESKNPVWVFPTESTNFIRINNDIDHLMLNAETLSGISKDSAAFQTGISNIGERSLSIRQNIMDATPYMFVSISNIVFSTMWIAAILGIFAALKRKKDQLTAFDEAAGV
ncbi:MAG: glycosyl transferase, partial [Nitrosarchaeum sp.]